MKRVIYKLKKNLYKKKYFFSFKNKLKK